MKQRRSSWKGKAKLIVSICIAMAAVEFFYSCDQPTDPSKDSNCGSGNVEWDVKGQVCRDLGRHTIVPSSCCGY